MLVHWNLSSPFYLHYGHSVIHHPSSYRKKVSFYFVYACLQLCLVWSFMFILWQRTYSIWISDRIFWFITSFQSLNHHSVITSKVPVCYSAKIMWGPGYNFTAFFFSKVKVLFAFSSLTKVILIKFYKVHCIILCLASSPFCIQLVNYERH